MEIDCFVDRCFGCIYISRPDVLLAYVQMGVAFHPDPHCAILMSHRMLPHADAKFANSMTPTHDCQQSKLTVYIQAIAESQ